MTHRQGPRGERFRAIRDVALAGYDDTPVADALGLTSVHQRIDVIAQAVTAPLLVEMRDTPVEPRQLLVVPSLVVRSSSVALLPPAAANLAG